MQQNFLFTPGGANDPLVIQLPQMQDIHSFWVPAPTNKISFKVPLADGSWQTFYQILAISAESIPLDNNGFTTVQVSSDGTGGDPFWIVAYDQFVSPYKATVSAMSPTPTGDLRIFNVVDYGAQLDGVTDDQDAYQQADLAAHAAGGGMVFQPHGIAFFDGGSGSIANPVPLNGAAGTNIPVGPWLLHDNVRFVGSGFAQSGISLGPNYYTGAISRPPKTIGGTVQPNAGTCIANNGYWMNGDNVTPISHNCSVENVSIYGNGHLAPGAGNISPTSTPPLPQASILSGSLIELHAVENGYVEKVFCYDSFANGIILYGLLGGGGGAVPTLKGRIDKCCVNLNYPMWLQGSHWWGQANGFPDQPGGALPIRTEGCDDMQVLYCRVGELNVGRTSAPFLPGNTNDAIDCPTTSNLILHGSYVTKCGDGFGTNGMFNVVISSCIANGAGSVGIASYKSSLGQATSRLTITSCIVIDAGSNGPANPCLNIDSGSVGLTVSSCIFLSHFGTNPAVVNLLGDNVSFVDNYVGAGGTDSSILLRLSGNLINSEISSCDFDFGGATNSVAIKLGTCTNVSLSENGFSNAGTGCIGVSLPATNTYDAFNMSGNTFDDTIDWASGNVPIFLGVSFSAFSDTCRIAGNPGLNGPGLNPLNQAPVSPMPNPPGTGVFVNPYPFDCYVAFGPAGTYTANTKINGVDLLAPPNSEGQVYDVDAAGGTIQSFYSAKPTGGWVWVAK